MWNWMSGRFDSGRTRVKSPPWLMPMASGPRRKSSHSQPDLRRAPPRREIVVRGDGLGALVDEAHLEMILQISAYALTIRNDRDAVLAQQLRGADAGELQELRALDRASGEDHLACGLCDQCPAALPVLDSRGPRALEEDALGVGAGFHPQVRPAARGLQVRHRAARAPAVSREELEVAHALLARPVEVVVARHAQFTRAGDDRVDQLVATGNVGAGDGAVGAVIFGRAARIGLELAEVGEHVLPRPTGIAERCPVIVVLVLAADVDEPVDRGGAAEAAPARPVDLPTVHPGIGLGLELPVVDRVEHGLAVADRDMDPGVVVLRTRFQQQHGVAPVLRQARGQHAAGGAGADDDEIVGRRIAHGG